MRKKQKMSLYDMNNLNIHYHDFQRVKNADGLKGYRYTLDKPLTAEQLQAVNSYKNTIVSSCYYKYAPEIQYTTLILTDKCIK